MALFGHVTWCKPSYLLLYQVAVVGTRSRHQGRCKAHRRRCSSHCIQCELTQRGTVWEEAFRPLC